MNQSPPSEACRHAEELARSRRVFLFMKGSPDFPQCGFSARSVALLRQAGAEFGHCDVLSDELARQGAKELGAWPTFPQLYVDGELLGGSDILGEMAAAGSLAAAVTPVH